MISRAALNPGELEFAIWFLQAGPPDFNDERTFQVYVMSRAPTLAVARVGLNLFRKWKISA